MGSHALAILMHIDLSAQGSLTVQSVVFQILTTHKSVVDFGKPGWYFVSINPYADLSVKGDETFSIKLRDDSLKRSGLSNPLTPLQKPSSFNLTF